MKIFYTTLLFAMGIWLPCAAQTAPPAPDTLISEPVVGNPISTMLTVPSGLDDEWVNFDQDMGEGFCVENDLTPLGWFIEGDFGFLDPLATDNEAFTSCSYLNGGIRNHNWLILPPIQIPDASFQLCWRSLAFEGPAFMDGYKVLASTNSNLPSSGDFSNVLFTAAEMVKPKVPNVYTLNPADYVFSAGYIHANGYTDTNYYFFLPPDGPYRGRLEPHCVSLEAFAGQTIYLAFHHDSQDDSQLQVDDIIVSNDTHIATHQPSNFLDFSVMPNPVVSNTFVKWAMQKPEPGRLQLRDMAGKLVLERPFGAYSEGQLFLELEGVAPGVYSCSLLTGSGVATRRVVKL